MVRTMKSKETLSRLLVLKETRQTYRDLLT